MKAENLLDAIGMIDDRHLMGQTKPCRHFGRRKIVGLIAAVLVLTQLVFTALAHQEEVRKVVLDVWNRIFRVETYNEPTVSLDALIPASTQLPPTGQTEMETIGTDPTVPEVENLATVNIEEVVHAHYFYSERITVIDGGFYTFSERNGDAAPESGTFWEIRPQGIVDVGATRVDFVLSHGGKEYAIIFDYGIVDGELAVKGWLRVIGEAAVQNGLGVAAIGDRKDVVMLSIPVDMGLYESIDYFVIDLQTFEVTELFESYALEHMWIAYAWYTDDLRYAIISADDMIAGKGGYWFFDLEQGTMIEMGQWLGGIIWNPYFLDDSTLIYHESLGDDLIHVIRYDLLTGEKTILLESIYRKGDNGRRYAAASSSGKNGRYGLVYEEDGTVMLMDLKSGETVSMEGVDLSAYRSESPDGERIIFTYRQKALDEPTGFCYPSVGILDPAAETLTLLERSINGNLETFYGCLNNNTLVFTSRSADGGWYVYVYEFI